MYDPNTGRWSSEDPIGFSAEDMNLYRYVKDNPMNAVDPSGLIGLPAPVKHLARAEWKAFVLAIRDRYPLTADLLEWSLQDNPPDVFFRLSNPLTRAMRDSQEFKTLVMQIGKTAPIGRIPPKVAGIVFSSGDLMAGVHEAEVHYRGFKKDNANFDLLVSFADTYDFDLHMKEGFRELYLNWDLFKTAAWSANNLAWWDEVGGIIVPYKWTTDTFAVKVRDGRILNLLEAEHLKPLGAI